MENLLIVALQVGILFVLIGTGALCRRLRLVDEFSVKGLVNVLVLIVTPALIIHVFQQPFDRALLKQFGLAFVIAAAMHFVLIGLALLTARGDERTLPVLRVATVFSNAGFMGIPLEYAILGPKGVFFGIVYVAMFNLFMWSWGILQMKGRSGEQGRFPLQAVINPGTVGIAIGLPLFLFSVPLPEIVRTPVKMMADLNTPLAMLVIGYYLAGADLKSVMRLPGAHVAAFIRLVACPLILIGALWCFHASLDRSMMLAMVIAASAPSAAMVAMFAAKYDRDVDLSVGLVSGTTVLSIVTMPPIIALAMSLFKTA